MRPPDAADKGHNTAGPSARLLDTARPFPARRLLTEGGPLTRASGLPWIFQFRMVGSSPAKITVHDRAPTAALTPLKLMFSRHIPLPDRRFTPGHSPDYPSEEPARSDTASCASISSKSEFIGPDRAHSSSAPRSDDIDRIAFRAERNRAGSLGYRFS
jgi:hypothetical protein